MANKITVNKLAFQKLKDLEIGDYFYEKGDRQKSPTLLQKVYFSGLGDSCMICNMHNGLLIDQDPELEVVVVDIEINAKPR